MPIFWNSGTHAISQTRHIRQRVGLRADQDLIMEVRPLVRDGVDLDPGILFLKLGG